MWVYQRTHWNRVPAAVLGYSKHLKEKGVHTPGPPRKLPERSQLKEPWRNPKSLSLYFRWSSIEKPGNPKLNNYPFFIQPGASLTSLYFRWLIRVEQGFRCLAQMCCCMYSMSSVVHWEDNTEETSQQQKYNYSSSARECKSCSCVVRWTEARYWWGSRCFCWRNVYEALLGRGAPTHQQVITLGKPSVSLPALP